MYCLIAIFAFTFTNAASSGAKKCDALGLCTHVASGAYQNPETGEIGCPWGMHLVSPPQRSDAYIVSTAPYGEVGPTYYTPGQFLDIHVITVGPAYYKFLGILMYAVQYADVLGPEGCRSPGCNGLEEVKLGSWEVTSPLFQVSTPCEGQAVTHRNADVKPYHNVFRWKAPEAGSGDVIFRVVIKQGSTNMGHFWWPMEKDLMLTEGPVESVSEWFSGDISLTCSQICASQNRDCDRSMSTGSLDLYKNHVAKTQSCNRPLLSSCSRTPPTIDEEGYCWFDNQDSGLCGDSQPSQINICDAVEAAGGSERLCPCIPENTDGWTPQTTQAPTQAPSPSEPTSSPSTQPTSSEPTSMPTEWWAPRWVEKFRGTETCARSGQHITRACKRGCTVAQCQNFCANNQRCKFFYRSDRGYCGLYSSCDVTFNWRDGVTIEKVVIPTNQPSFSPSISQPTSSPSQSPSHWYDPRWVQIDSGEKTCSGKRIARPCKTGCSAEQCQDYCADNSECKFYNRNSRGYCGLFSSCDVIDGGRYGIIVRKDVVPTEEPTYSPSFSSPSAAPSKSPSHWYDPRWVQIETGRKTCANSGQRIARPCRSGCSVEQCQTHCANNSQCKFYVRNERGFCGLFKACDNIVNSGRRTCIIVRKDVVPTTAMPATEEPAFLEITDATTWVVVFQDSKTCSRAERIARPFKRNASVEQCQEKCEANSQCEFFYRNFKGRCELFSSCDNTRADRYGVTMRKD